MIASVPATPLRGYRCWNGGAKDAWLLPPNRTPWLKLSEIGSFGYWQKALLKVQRIGPLWPLSASGSTSRTVEIDANPDRTPDKEPA